MSGIARTDATGGGGMLPALIEWSSSYRDDRRFAREDLLGSAAHVTMLARVGLVSADDAASIRGALFALYDDARADRLALADDEEDIHMAVEAELGKRLGAVAGRLHTARSRNDQVALDLHLHVRDQAASTLAELSALVRLLAERAKSEGDVLLPAYTHRQRAQPVTAAYVLAAWGAALARAGEVVEMALAGADVLPLGSGACSGSSLPIDRTISQSLLGFSRITASALDTVGERDFAIDWAYAGARVLLALSRLSTDVIDYSTSEFGFVKLDGAIAAGSSMMPQKKNPDVFELVRGKSAIAIGDVTALLALVKGLPGGYNRDLQEDRGPLLATAPRVRGAIAAMMMAIPRVRFDRERCAAALSDGSTQATDLAEALVRRGVPFREAYKAVGALVRAALEAGVPLAKVDRSVALTLHPALDEAALAALDAGNAAAAKESQGGTGARAVAAQIDRLVKEADRMAAAAAAIPTLDALADRLRETPFAG
jgi:argininosuccinate lyase